MSATQERAVRPLRSALRLASRPGPLGVIAVLLVIPMVFLTTVTVTSEQTVSDPTKVSISALDSRAGLLEDSLTGRRALARFFVVTNPFGRLFRISARGYLPTALVVYPPVGRNVVLGRDLPPAPSVLFRPFVEGISALNDKAVFQVSRITPKGAKEVLTTDTGIVASFRLGPARPITPSIIEFWRLELESYDASPPLRAHMLMVWNTPRELKWAGDLSPGDSLQAEILRRGKVIARASFAVTRDPLMDVLIMDLPIESSPRP